MIRTAEILSPMLLVPLLMFSSELPRAFSSGSSHAPPAKAMDQVLRGSFQPTVSESRTEPAVSLLSWNIERGTRLEKILGAFRGDLKADLYLLQEVDLETRRAGGRNVAEELARGLGTNYVFGIEFEELAQGCHGSMAYQGQAVLSRFPIISARVLRFQNQLYDWNRRWKLRLPWLQPRKGGRMALVVELKIANRTVVVYNTHLESRADDAGRAVQMKEILDDLRSHYAPGIPVIVAGDLNSWKGAASPIVQELKGAGFRDVLENGRGSLRTKVRSNRRKDWVFLRHLNSSDARVTHVRLSDHFPLAVSISMPEAAAWSAQDTAAPGR